MSLQTLLGDVPKQQFVAEHLHRLPCSRAGTAAGLCELGTWELLGRILERPEPADLMVVREGRRHAGADPQRLQEARNLCEAGCTILVRHAERHDGDLTQLADSFADDLHAPVNIHLYVTPPGTHGFSWHYDAEDVFIIQTAGAKEYSLRKNTVHPWPLAEAMPRNMRYERELMPLMRVELWAGDWLYIPCGYWHKADAKPGEAAISLAVGVMSHTAVEVLEVVREHALGSLLWRQRLPTTGAASPLSEEELEERYAEILSQLADDLSGLLKNDHMARRLRERISFHR